jgi:hypothetical protein
MGAESSGPLGQGESIGAEDEPASAVRTLVSTVLVLIAYVLTMLALAALAFTDVASPSSGRVHCGQVVKRSIELRHDVTGCKYDGLVAGRSGITIDLNGHTVAGLGEAVGVSNTRRVRLFNLRILKSADVGMRVLRSRGGRFRRIRGSSNSDAGIRVFRSKER